MHRNPTRVDPVATCPACEHPGLQLGETRTLEHGVELHLWCLGCGESSALTIAETPHRSGDESRGTITATTTVKPPATEPTAKQAMLDVLDEAHAHAQATIKLLGSGAFIEGRLFARETPRALVVLLGTAQALAGALAEEIASTRTTIRQTDFGARDKHH